MAIEKLNREQLYIICSNFRKAIDKVKKEHGFHKKSLMQDFPNGCCGNTTTLLRFYLRKEYGIETKEYLYRHGDESDPHSFLMYDDLVIDLTSDQPALNRCYSVYVDVMDDFYESMTFEAEYDFYDFEEEYKGTLRSETSIIYHEDYKNILKKLKNEEL